MFLGSSISSVLNKLAVKVVSNENCKKSYGSIIHNSTICAIGIDRGTGTCQVNNFFDGAENPFSCLTLHRVIVAVLCNTLQTSDVGFKLES